MKPGSKLVRGQPWVRRYILRCIQTLMRYTLCRLGIHSPATGDGVDACTRGCGHLRNPEALRPYVVVLKDGSEVSVNAVNVHHAISLVMYGEAPLRIDARGNPIGEVVVHRSNIVSVFTQERHSTGE